MKQGQIIFQVNNQYEVLVERDVIRASVAGALRLTHGQPCVGDYVEVSAEHVITRILPRRNALARPRVANIDQVAIVAALTAPHLNLLSLYKLLAIVEFYALKPLLIFTKPDLITSNAPAFLDASYAQYVIDARAALPAPLISAFTGQLTALAGQSGVGKSTLAKALTGLDVVIGVTSVKNDRGKHTTRAARIMPLQVASGSIIDTPGFSLLEIKLTKLALAQSYHDFRALAPQCKYANCLHDSELAQSCAIKRAVSAGKISAQKYAFYLKLLKTEGSD